MTMTLLLMVVAKEGLRAGEEAEDEEMVDIVIYLPRKHSETWLDEWSDLDNMDDVTDSYAKSLDNEVFPLSQL